MCRPFPGWGSQKRKCYVGFHMRSLEGWVASDISIVDKTQWKGMLNYSNTSGLRNGWIDFKTT